MEVFRTIEGQGGSQWCHKEATMLLIINNNTETMWMYMSSKVKKACLLNGATNEEWA